MSFIIHVYTRSSVKIKLLHTMCIMYLKIIKKGDIIQQKVTNKSFLIHHKNII